MKASKVEYFPPVQKRSKSSQRHSFLLAGNLPQLGNTRPRPTPSQAQMNRRLNKSLDAGRGRRPKKHVTWSRQVTEDYETAEENRRQARFERLNDSLHEYISDIQKAKEELNHFKELYLTKPFYVLRREGTTPGGPMNSKPLPPGQGNFKQPPQIVKQHSAEDNEDVKEAMSRQDKQSELNAESPVEAKTNPGLKFAPPFAHLAGGTTPSVILKRAIKSTKHVRSFVHPPTQ
jgi:hypothetical protein